MDKLMRITEDQIKKIILLYSQGNSSHNISKKLGIGKTTVLNYLKSNNIRRRNNREIKLNKTYEEIFGIEKANQIKKKKKEQIESNFLICKICDKKIKRKSYSQIYCKQCSNKLSKERDKSQARRYRKKYPERRRAMLRALRKKLRGEQCYLCGGNRFLHFHHTNYKKDEGFTLCAKCHKKTHKNRGEIK